MAISDKSRKLLWGRSGSHCAFCQKSLIVEKTDDDSESVVGDEAHIVSKRPGGPRGHIQLKCDHDDYENFILLCRIHHKMVDDQPNTYTFEFLLLLKGMHEFWVDQQLTRVESKSPGPHLSRIERGKDLTIFFKEALAFLTCEILWTLRKQKSQLLYYSNPYQTIWICGMSLVSVTK